MANPLSASALVPSSPPVDDSVLRETFYNTMFELALENDLGLRLEQPAVQNELVHKVIKQMCRHGRVTQQQPSHPQQVFYRFPTMRGMMASKHNVSASFVGMFTALESLCITPNQALEDGLTLQILARPVFQEILAKLVGFYRESNTEAPALPPVGQVSMASIQETFYNLMVTEVLINGNITPANIEDQDPFIYVGLSALTILSVTLQTLQSPGIPLLNGSVVTMANCPKENGYQELFTQLLRIKAQLAEAKLSEDQLQLVRLYASTDPDVEPAAHLLVHKTPALMQLVALITSVAIQISAVPYFKTIIQRVIDYILECLQERK